MRVSTGVLASSAVLFLFGAAGTVGTWALVVGTVLALIGGVGFVIAMEDRDQAEGGIAAFAEVRAMTSKRVA